MRDTIHWIFVNKNFELKFSKFPQLWKVWSHYMPVVWSKGIGRQGQGSILHRIKQRKRYVKRMPDELIWSNSSFFFHFSGYLHYVECRQDPKVLHKFSCINKFHLKKKEFENPICIFLIPEGSDLAFLHDMGEKLAFFFGVQQNFISY